MAILAVVEIIVDWARNLTQIFGVSLFLSQDSQASTKLCAL